MNAGSWLLRNTLLDVLASEAKLEQSKWLLNAAMAYHLTLSIDGWSNHRMESIYAWNVIFPSRRTILLRTDDLSSMSHTGENLACHYAQLAVPLTPLCGDIHDNIE